MAAALPHVDDFVGGPQPGRPRAPRRGGPGWPGTCVTSSSSSRALVLPTACRSRSATVVGTRSSAPRPPGAAMAVAATGEALGSVSGGCVEGAVLRAGRGGAGRRAAAVASTTAICDDEAFGVGLTCGGEHRHLRRARSTARRCRAARGRGGRDPRPTSPVAVATVVGGPARARRPARGDPGRRRGHLGTEGLDVAVTDDARGMLAQGQTGDRHYGTARRAPRRRRHRVRAVLRAAAADATSSARSTSPPRSPAPGVFLGYRVTVCDARAVFATRGASRGRRGRVRVAAPLPASQPAGGRAHGDLRCSPTTPSSTCPLLEVALRTDAALHRRDGHPAHPRRPARPAPRARRRPRPSWRGCSPRSASTSAPAPLRRPRSRSPPRSCSGAGAAPASPWAQPAGASTRTAAASRLDDCASAMPSRTIAPPASW